MKKLLFAACILLGSYGAASAFTDADNNNIIRAAFGELGCNITVNLYSGREQAYFVVVPPHRSYLEIYSWRIRLLGD